jgi:hypothetical protein
VINLGCSWNLHAGRDANIEITFYGTGGGASLRNVNGSFYDFVAERFHRTETEVLDTRDAAQAEWGSLATLAWIEQLSAGGSFDAKAEQLITVAEVIDQIYGRT